MQKSDHVIVADLSLSLPLRQRESWREFCAPFPAVLSMFDTGSTDVFAHLHTRSGKALETGRGRRRMTTDIIVIGAGPAGVVAARRAAELGATTTLITRDEFGGMAANDGPVPVRTLAQAARLMREARQLRQYGIVMSEPRLEYPR